MPNNITITEITSPSKLWEVSYNVDSAGAKIANLMTSGTFLDRNIGIKITTPPGNVTGPSSLSGSGATLSTGTNTLTLTKSGITTTPTVTSGYVTTATSSSATITLTASVTTKEAKTYNVSTSNQTIGGNQYLTGTQTFRGVTTNNIDANKIKSGIVITVGDSDNAARIKSVTGTFTSSSTVSSGQTAATAAHILTGYSAWVDGEEIQGTLNGSASQTATVTVTGSGTATTPTITRITTGASNIGSGSATTTAPSSGYFVAMKATAPITTLTMTKTVNTSGLLTSNSQITASAATTAKDSNTYYITVPSSTITNNTTLPSGTSSSGTINRGSYIKIGVGYNGTDKYYLAQANSGTITISKSGNTTVNGYATANVPATSVTQGTSTISNNTVTRGTASWGTGWITTSSISPASFANTATENVTYLDISNTTEAPMLSSSGYLYINKGYTDNLRISLAKLIPDWPNGTSVAAAGHILSGYKAYDQDGAVLTGSIQTKTVSNVTASGKTVTIPAGYYASQVTKNVSLGTVTSGSAKITSATYTYDSTNTRFNVAGSANVSAPTVGTAGYVSSSEGTKNANNGGAALETTVARIGIKATITGTAKVTPAISKITTASGNNATNITAQVSNATTTKPTSGYYVAVQSAASANDITATPSVSSAGYGTTTSGQYGATNAILSVGANASSVTYFPITAGSCTIAGGVLSTSGYSKTDLALTLASGSDSNMSNISIGAKDTTNYAYYFKVNGSTPAVSGTTSASVTPITDTHTAGYIPAKSTTNFRGTQLASPSVSVNATSSSTYINLKAATMTVAGTNTVSPTASVAGTSATLVTTNNSGISVTATGGGTASVTATATTNVAGYAPASTQLGSATLSATNKTTTTTKYLKEVEIVKPSSGTREFGIKVPNGDSTITFVFHVDSSGNVTVDNEYSLTY